MSKYKLNINGAPKTVNVASDTPLLWVLRDHLNLAGNLCRCGTYLRIRAGIHRAAEIAGKESV